MAMSGKYMTKKSPEGTKMVRCISSLFGIGLGGWLIFMAWHGASPAETLDTAERMIFCIFGLVLGSPALCMLLHTFMSHERGRKILEAALYSSSLFFAGLAFFTVGILKPGKIGATLSIGGHAIPVLDRISIGAIIFVLVGIGLMSAARGTFKSILKSPNSALE